MGVRDEDQSKISIKSVGCKLIDNPQRRNITNLDDIRDKIALGIDNG